MQSKSPFLRCIGLVFIIILLSQCSKVTENQAQTLKLKKQPTQAFPLKASAYLALAEEKSGEEQARLILMAAGSLVTKGQLNEAQQILSKTKNLSAVLESEKNILQAKIDINRSRATPALLKLSSVHDLSSLPSIYQEQYHETLALAYKASGKALESVMERIRLDNFLMDEKKIAQNHQQLWLLLSKIPLEELHTLTMESSDQSPLQGWVKLALIARETKDPNLLYNDLQSWQTIYSNHPANQFLPFNLSSIKNSLYPKPRQLALLIPVTGPLAGPGNAIRDGFMEASSKSHVKKVIRLYDTGQGHVVALYRQAIEDGADYIIGPLSKADVTDIAQIEHPVPTLLLNDFVANDSMNAYGFGLSPSEEAKHVAIKATQSGLHRALVIAPAGPWGEEITKAFSSKWVSRGGKIVDKLVYDDSLDLNMGVRNLLHVNESQAREKKLRQWIGHPIEIIQNRRQDFDVIFLLAYPTKARQIMPLLKYYFAGNVPVYATSTVYSGTRQPMKDKDLDGIIFCDMPWIFHHQLDSKNWPEPLNSYSRLFALGMDSYQLASEFNQLKLFKTIGTSNFSAPLQLKKMHQISRLPAWGQFKGGIALLIEKDAWHLS